MEQRHKQPDQRDMLVEDVNVDTEWRHRQIPVLLGKHQWHRLHKRLRRYANPAQRRMDDSQATVPDLVRPGQSCLAEDSIQISRLGSNEAGSLQHCTEKTARHHGELHQKSRLRTTWSALPEDQTPNAVARFTRKADSRHHGQLY